MKEFCDQFYDGKFNWIHPEQKDNEIIVINLKDDEVEFMEEAEDLDEAELNAEMEGLIVLANEFYDREMERYEKE
mgnify:CR=1 FL=1